MNPQIINIAIVDDHTLFRHGIANLLSEFQDIHVVFEASNGKEMQDLLPRNTGVEVILMDINMRIMDGYAATTWIKENFPNVNVLALSMFEDDIAVIKMLKAGAGGYVLKESSPIELYQAISSICHKGVYINEMVSGKMLRSFQEESNSQNIQRLTEREIEFIRLCVSELTYKEIAHKMNLAPRSVENYRETLFEKLQLKSRVGLVLYAIKNHLIEV